MEKFVGARELFKIKNADFGDAFATRYGRCDCEGLGDKISRLSSISKIIIVTWSR